MSDLRTFRITVAYDGTAYAGWQVQPHAETVQGVLERAAGRINGEPTSVLGAGRTDAGVHARGQAARFTTRRDLEARRVPHALNAYLPPDVVVTSALRVPDGFHPIGDARGKHYRYTFRLSEHADPFDRSRVLHLRDVLDPGAMRVAAGHLLGEHDFAAFEKVGSPRSTTVRTLSRLDVSSDGPYIYVDFVGNGFLYGMARNLAGTLWRVGRGRLSPESIPPGLVAREAGIAGPCLPARGLCLMQVFYAEDDR
jgi:tRNA pseudouridine38-40 synthase